MKETMLDTKVTYTAKGHNLGFFCQLSHKILDKFLFYN